MAAPSGPRRPRPGAAPRAVGARLAVAAALAATGCTDVYRPDSSTLVAEPVPVEGVAGAAYLDTTPFPEPPGGLPGWSAFVHGADGAIIGVVLDMDGAARWNGPDGEFWDPGEAAGLTPDGRPRGRPIWYCRVRVRVDEVLFDSPTLPLAPGDVVEVHIHGTGEPRGPWSEAYGTTAGEVDGMVAVNESVLWVLDAGEFYQHPGGFEPAVLLHWHLMGNWRIDGSGAVNARPERTVLLGPLRDALVAARAAPLDPAGRTGWLHPLEGP